MPFKTEHTSKLDQPILTHPKLVSDANSCRTRHIRLPQPTDKNAT
jgi:hypothetical protein